MNHLHYLIGPIFALAASTAAWGQLPSSTPAPAAADPAQQVIVLRNGNIFEGRIDHLGDAYRIVTANSEIRLPTRDVERIVATLQDAYAAKLAEVRADSAVDHIRLAVWCIRHELWQQAEAELQSARKIDAKHPDIAFVERRLKVAARAALRARRKSTVAAPATSNDSDRQKAAELAEFEKLAQSLPPGSLESFARHVQPIVVNGCSAVGCHSTEDDQQFRLNRDLLRGVANRESTLRNLAAVWQSIDHEHYLYSPLLTQPAVPHGGLSRPVFDGHRQKLQQRLTEWVKKATGNEQPQPSPPAVELATHQLPAGNVHASGTNTAATSTGNTDLHFWEFEADGQNPSAQKPTVQRGIQPMEYQARDEFDPELFNRQVAPRSEQHQQPARSGRNPLRESAHGADAADADAQ